MHSNGLFVSRFWPIFRKEAAQWEPTLNPSRHSGDKRKPMTHTQHEKDLLVVFAVEEYARRHGISAHETLALFLKCGITESIRQCYDTLHTQDMHECVLFAEDILKRKNA